MNLKYLTMLFAVVALSLVAVACSGSDDDSSNDGDQPTATSEAPDGDGDGNLPTATTEATGNNGGGFGSGTATLTIGDETWEISGVLCVMSTEESGSEMSPFNLSAFTQTPESDRVQLYADIYDGNGQGRREGEGVSYQVKLADVSQAVIAGGDQAIDWQTNSLADFQLDGKNLTVNAVFDDGTTGDIEAIPGTLVATCP